MSAFQAHPTPNPNSLKLTTALGPFIPTGMEAFASAEQAAHHPLGAALFGVEGVTNVFIMPAFLTITKAPAAAWDGLMAAVEAILHRHFEGTLEGKQEA